MSELDIVLGTITNFLEFTKCRLELRFGVREILFVINILGS